MNNIIIKLVPIKIIKKIIFINVTINFMHNFLERTGLLISSVTRKLQKKLVK